MPPSEQRPVAPSEIADQLTDLARTQLEALVRQHMPAWQPPRVFAGHPTGPDVRADLAFTLAALHDNAVTHVAGTPVDEAIERTLRTIDGAATHTFFSYRVAETLARFGRWGTNRLLEGWSVAERDNIAAACDSTSWVELLDGGLLPANYAAVLARCEIARRNLGIETDEALAGQLVDRTANLLTRNPRGFLDDSPDGTAGRYDIYTVDLYLFTEPFSELLPAWTHGFAAVVDLVDCTCARTGEAICWGRSTGALGVCHTLELGALALERGLASDTARWIGRLARAVKHLQRWFSDGLITAHQNRSPYRYRGPGRRIQMTLDCLGKIAWAAAQLRRAPGDPILPAEPGHLDRWIPFDDRAGVWAFRSRDLAFTLPAVGTAWSDYLPAPRNPGLFEVPVDRPLPTATPYALRGSTLFAAGGVAAEVRKEPGSLVLRYEGLPAMAGTDRSEPNQALPGTRIAELRVQGRALTVREELTFDEPPDAVALQVAEAAGRPLRVELHCDTPHTTTVIGTAGLAEYRSFWSELVRVHQIDLEPARQLRFRWSLTPLLRVATDGAHHWYHQSLYAPIAGDVVTRPFHRDRIDHPRAGEWLEQIDLYHLHWPEWLFDTDTAAATRFVDLLRRHEVRLIWTQHNLLPHRDGDYEELYRIFAEAADGVIHHSRWGQERVLAHRRYNTDAIHRVIPHGHWGELVTETPERHEALRSLGLEEASLRIGIVGAPRPGKDTVRFIEAFSRCTRDDIALLVLSLDPSDVEALATDDPRVTALPYEFVDRSTYDQRLACIDLLAFPFRSDGRMLTTGVVGDAIAHGLPALVTGWGYLLEALGDAAIPMGDDPESWVTALEGIDRVQVERAAAAVEELRQRTAWAEIAAQTLDLLEEVGTAKL